MSIKEVKAKIKALHEQAIHLNIKSLQYAEVIDEINNLKAELKGFNAEFLKIVR